MGIVGIYDSEPFISEIILPDQFFSRRSPNSPINNPEKKLMYAVFEDALKCFLRGKNKQVSKRSVYLSCEAKEWFYSCETGWLFSFENICDVLGLSAEAIREALL